MNLDYLQPGMTGPFENAGAPINGSNAVQTITVDATSGTWNVIYDGFKTTALAFNISGANLQTALEALPNVDPGDIAVTGNGPYTLTFGGNLAKKVVSVVTTDATALVGNTHTAAVVNTTPGVAASGRGVAKGAVLIDTSSGIRYQNMGTALIPDWVQVAGGAASQTIQVTIPTASILALNTTPFTLIAAPGAGKLILVDSIVAKLVFNSVAYTGANALEFRYTNGSGAKVTADIAAAFINSAAGTNYNSVKSVVTALTPVANAPIVAFVPTANPGAGNSDILITVSYQIITP